MKTKNNTYITVQDLYKFAMENKLLDARIRICDGMAVSYYPDGGAVLPGRYEVVIDVSANTPVEYDELDQWAQIQYLEDREREHTQFLLDTEHRRRSEYIRRNQARRNAATPVDYESKRWIISGYGPFKKG